MEPTLPRDSQAKTEPDLPQAPARTVSSGEVLRGQQELHINHGDAIYTLRVTRQGKLILTK